MKKIILATVLTLALLLVMAYTVMADNGPHGSFTATTDACANCHRAHSAKVGSNQLLIQSDAETLCKSCHNGTGASTDVVNGIYHSGISPVPNGTEGTDGASLFGGGFDNALMATAWSGEAMANAAFNATSRPSTSNHSLGEQGFVYGSGGINTAEATMTLECTSCHDPHGNAGFAMTANAATSDWTASTTKVASYRLLRFQPQGSGSFTAPATTNWSGKAFPASGTTNGWTVPDDIAANGAEWYTIGTTGAFAVGDYNAGNGTSAYNVRPANNYVKAAVNVSYFCAQCHDRYFANSRLRNNTDASAYCGTPITATPVVLGLVTLTPRADADGVAPWIHPVDPTRCEPVLTGNALTGWGDNGSTGDNVHTYMHSSGDTLRASSDGTVAPAVTAMTGPTSLGRGCVACHVSHGTASQMTATAGQANQVYAETSVNSSTLLRMDNRSLCLRCHAGDVGFTVVPAPVITTLVPATAVAGGAGFTLTVTGTGFTSTSVVRWNGSARTTTYVSATQLTATITAADIAAAGTVPVTVSNSTASVSSAASFTVTAAP